MLKKHDTAFILIDVQGKLSEMVYESEKLLVNLQRLIKGLKALQIPIVWVEQYPEGLGETNEHISKHLEGETPIVKRTFSACRNEDFMKEIKKLNRNQWIIAGIEAHVCVYQTAVELKDIGYDVQLVTDAISSRVRSDKLLGIEKMKEKGVNLTSVEMALFELLETSEGDLFKEVIQHIK